ncbi:MAG: serine protease [Muribaculaceae bacterium]|jgi:S1-C subfamily serine protease|nr:serine protease [Muribaculaceae bacterium]
MKRICSYLLLHLWVSVLIAQISPRNGAELRAYYQRNFDNLDPIEGIYDVSVEQWSKNAYTKFPGETTNYTVMIYRDKNGVFRWYENDQVEINRVGETNYYKYSVFWSGSDVVDTKRFLLKDSQYFEVAMSVPDRQLRYDLGRNYQAGFEVHFDYSFIKVYPTNDMYAERNQRIAEMNKAPKEWTGTGFAINNGYIVTNYHVIENANTIKVKGIKGEFNRDYNGVVVGTDKDSDLAIIKIQDDAFSGFGKVPYSIVSSQAEVGEDVFVLGYPLTSTMGEEIKLTTGIISSKTGFKGDVRLYQFSAPIQPGNSGGPLFNAKGNIIGVVSAKHSGTENVGYAIKSIYLKNLIESTIDASILPTSSAVSNLTRPGLVKKYKDYVFIICCFAE